MNTSPKTNLAAGTRTLGARSHARLLDEQCEVLTRVQAADRMLFDLLAWAKEQHGVLRAAERSMIAANERASSATYERPSMLALTA